MGQPLCWILINTILRKADKQARLFYFDTLTELILLNLGPWDGWVSVHAITLYQRKHIWLCFFISKVTSLLVWKPQDKWKNHRFHPPAPLPPVFFWTALNNLRPYSACSQMWTISAWHGVQITPTPAITPKLELCPWWRLEIALAFVTCTWTVVGRVRRGTEHAGCRSELSSHQSRLF